MRISQLVLLITLLILLISSSACVRLREIPKDAPPLMTPEEYKNFVAKYDTTAAKLASQQQRESKTSIDIDFFRSACVLGIHPIG